MVADPQSREHQGRIIGTSFSFQGRNMMKLPRRKFLHLAAGAAALPVVRPAPALGHGAFIPTNATMSVERAQYFAKPGLAADVRDLRRTACAVRLSIGLP